MIWALGHYTNHVFTKLFTVLEVNILMFRVESADNFQASALVIYPTYQASVILVSTIIYFPFCSSYFL
jgi:hypothetical protein